MADRKESPAGLAQRIQKTVAVTAGVLHGAIHSKRGPDLQAAITAGSKPTPELAASVEPRKP